ncbi:NADH:flavin oxidoreductase/NADH oxidase [Rhodococcus globerulus]|uniref:NADH:flavin oxidoreductase/NADH oxidase n=1 Tax=Rhodococcus globerulus TaxID=33008 RepID=UPI003CC8A968
MPHSTLHASQVDQIHARPQRQVQLFSPMSLRAIETRNRVWVSPMCQHSAIDGHPTDWHLVHLGSRAVGGAGLVMAESTSVRADGRIAPYDAGIWADSHIAPWARITEFLRENGAVAAIQLGHAGRKASTYRPWDGTGSVPIDAGGWPTLGPTAEPFGVLHAPSSATDKDLKELVQAFADAVTRSVMAGFEVIEIHAAHGYLLHQFLSPVVNTRTDNYGGSFENRARLTLEVVEAARARMPESMPLFVRVSATDWENQGRDVEEIVRLVNLLKERGVDLIDVSTGGNVAQPTIPTGPGYQVPFSAKIRQETGMPTAAVGLITDPTHAEAIISSGNADAVMIGRRHLDDPYWAKNAATQLRAEPIRILQYDRPELRN